MAQYLKPDSELGYVEDNAEIEKLKFNNLRHSIMGCMLGDFNDVGAYVVSPEIVEELISMEKYLVQTYDNIELCKSCLKLDKQISFLVTFEGNRATLSLVEKLNYEANFKIDSGTYSNLNEYVLDSVETNGEVNRNVLYARWNIKTTPSAVIDIFNCDDSVLEKYFGICNRFKYLMKANKLLLEREEELEEIEADYATQILSILAQYPELQKEVLKTIKETLIDKKDAVNIKKPFFAKTFNELLENAIQKNIGVLTQEQRKEFEIEKRNSTVEKNIKCQDVFEVETIATQDETTPTTTQLKVDAFMDKSITELATEFVDETSKVTNKYAGENVERNQSLIQQATERAATAKREALIKKLEEVGLGTLVGVVANVASATATTGNSSTTATASANANKNAKSTASKGDSKGNTNKKGGASAGKGGKGSGGKSAKSTSSTSTKKKDTDEVETDNPVYVAPVNASTDDVPVKEHDYDDEEFLSIEDMEKVANQKNAQNTNDEKFSLVADVASATATTGNSSTTATAARGEDEDFVLDDKIQIKTKINGRIAVVVDEPYLGQDSYQI